MSDVVDLMSTLVRFDALPRHDQRAIARLLTQNERTMLEALLKRRRRPALPAPEPAADTGAYSPWLAQRLRELSQSDAVLTDLTRQALATALAPVPRGSQ